MELNKENNSLILKVQNISEYLNPIVKMSKSQQKMSIHNLGIFLDVIKLINKKFLTEILLN